VATRLKKTTQAEKKFRVNFLSYYFYIATKWRSIPGLLTKVKSPCRLSVAKAEKNNASRKKIGTTFLSYYFYINYFYYAKIVYQYKK